MTVPAHFHQPNHTLEDMKERTSVSCKLTLPTHATGTSMLLGTWANFTNFLTVSCNSFVSEEGSIAETLEENYCYSIEINHFYFSTYEIWVFFIKNRLQKTAELGLV